MNPIAYVENANAQKIVNIKIVLEGAILNAFLMQVIKKMNIYVIQDIFVKKNVGLKITLKIVKDIVLLNLLIQKFIQIIYVIFQLKNMVVMVFALTLIIQEIAKNIAHGKLIIVVSMFAKSI